jgi:hypothetical protein
MKSFLGRGYELAGASKNFDRNWEPIFFLAWKETNLWESCRPRKVRTCYTARNSRSRNICDRARGATSTRFSLCVGCLV